MDEADDSHAHEKCSLFDGKPKPGEIFASCELPGFQDDQEISRSSSAFLPLIANSSEISHLEGSQLQHCFDEQDIIETLPLTQSIGPDPVGKPSKDNGTFSKMKKPQEAASKAAHFKGKSQTAKASRGKSQENFQSSKTRPTQSKESLRNKTASPEGLKAAQAGISRPITNRLAQKHSPDRSLSTGKEKMSALNWILEKEKFKKEVQKKIKEQNERQKKKEKVENNSSGKFKRTVSSVKDKSPEKKSQVAPTNEEQQGTEERNIDSQRKQTEPVSGLPQKIKSTGNLGSGIASESPEKTKTKRKKEEGLVSFRSSGNLVALQGETGKNQKKPNMSLFAFCPSGNEALTEGDDDKRKSKPHTSSEYSVRHQFTRHAKPPSCSPNARSLGVPNTHQLDSKARTLTAKLKEKTSSQKAENKLISHRAIANSHNTSSKLDPHHKSAFNSKNSGPVVEYDEIIKTGASRKLNPKEKKLLEGTPVKNDDKNAFLRVKSAGHSSGFVSLISSPESKLKKDKSHNIKPQSPTIKNHYMQVKPPKYHHGTGGGQNHAGSATKKPSEKSSLVSSYSGSIKGKQPFQKPIKDEQSQRVSLSKNLNKTQEKIQKGHKDTENLIKEAILSKGVDSSKSSTATPSFIKAIFGSKNAKKKEESDRNSGSTIQGELQSPGLSSKPLNDASSGRKTLNNPGESQAKSKEKNSEKGKTPFSKKMQEFLKGKHVKSVQGRAASNEKGKSPGVNRVPGLLGKTNSVQKIKKSEMSLEDLKFEEEKGVSVRNLNVMSECLNEDGEEANSVIEDL